MATITSTEPYPAGLIPPPLEAVFRHLDAGHEPPRRAEDGFPLFPDDPLAAEHARITEYLAEAVAACGDGGHYDFNPASSAAGRAIIEDAGGHGAALRAIAARVLWFWKHAVHFRDGYWHYKEGTHRPLLGNLAAAIWRKRPALSGDDLLHILAPVTGPQSDSYVFYVGGRKHLMRAAERHVRDNGLTPPIRLCLEQIREKWTGELAYEFMGRGGREVVAAIDLLLGKSAAPGLRTGEPWAEDAVAFLAALDGAARKAWEELIAHALASTGSKPSGKFLKQAKKLVEAVTAAEFSKRVGRWLSLAATPRTSPLAEDQTNRPAYNVRPEYDVYADDNENILKGLAWSCPAAGDASLATPLGALAEWCFKKIPNLGPRSPKVGNACLTALTMMPGPQPAAELSRLKSRVKQPTAKKMIEKAILASAARDGIGPDDLEELSIPTHGLTSPGRLTRTIGNYTAELQVVGTTKTQLTFTDGKGKARSSVPAELKRQHAEEVKQLQSAVKELGKMLPAHRDRLERLPISRRRLPTGDWRRRYLEHPVISTLARRLIWSFEAGGKGVAGIPVEGKILDADGRTIDDVPDDGAVSLWHPIAAPAGEVAAWRAMLEALRVTQPFKQAHREVYPLTEAEQATGTYSNRFANHILRQHVFAALCTQRGWKYRLQGGWDGGADSTPTITLPQWGLRAELWVQPVFADAGPVASHLSSDQVRFYAGGAKPMRLADVPALPFSEVMRDVDLFVGVCSVGNDPTAFQAPAENPAAGGARADDYWRSYAFGELGATARTRHDVLSRLLPRLKIKERASLSERFLVVRGTLRTYKIHLGSGNILMEPNDEYLCIVPGRAGGPGELFLPFEGDQTLSVILSKAFLLAADEKITDPTIVRQIKR